MLEKQFLHDNEENDYLREHQYARIHAIKSKQSNSLNNKELIRRWNIGLKTDVQTLKSTTRQCIRTTGLLMKRLKTKKSKIRYNKLSSRYGVIYTNKLGFKKFLPCVDK